MKTLTRDQIVSISDRKVEVIKVPEWGGSVGVRAMTGGQRDELERWSNRQRKAAYLDPEKIRAKILIWCLCDSHGAPLFQDGDEDALLAKNGRALDRCLDAARRLSGLTEEDVEELAGN